MLPQLLGSSIFVVIAVITFYYARKSRNQPDKAGKFFTNEVLIGVLYILTAILYPFFYGGTGISPETETTMYWISLLVWSVEITIFIVNILVEKGKCKRNPQLLVDRDYECVKTAYRTNYRYDVKKDFKRKALHLLAVLVIVIAWEMSRILDSFGALPLGMTDHPFAFYRWMVNTIGFAFIIMFAIGDLVRLMYNTCLPPWAATWFTSSIKEDELVTFSATAPLVLGLVPFLFAPYQLFLSVALITSLADAAASLVGKQFGKHHLSATSKKTFEGLFAGAVAAFTIVALAMGTLVSITIALSMAAIATSLFVLVDIFTKKLSDNIVNSLACGTGLVIVFLLV
ncbi:MAG: hypothetical protein RBG13Loki_1024 [Promethearchaeota archaeon CR_4]|nr:MAG: hypothetical protein RBG13Loki_1024 [Candidatus Lokiarchaeota archaeon CR_4]